MRKFITIFFLSLLCTLNGYSFSWGERKVDEPILEMDEEIIVNEISSLILIGSIDDYSEVKQIYSFSLVNLQLPGPEEELKEKLQKIYLNKPFTNKILRNIKEAIVDFYKKYNHPIVNIIVPEQEITNGVLQLVVLEGKIGDITVKNNRYWKAKRILKKIWLKENDYIDTNSLLLDIAWFNKNPFQNIDILLVPGKENGYTDIELLVKDRLPFRPYVGCDNTGTKYTGLNRVFLGFNWGNLFYSNQVFTYQYTASWDFHRFQAHTLNYTAHLPWYHTLMVYGGFTKNRPSLVGLKSEGKSTQASIRYEIPINAIYKNYQHTTTIGGDYKSSNNNLETVEETAQARISNKANLSQFMLGYKMNMSTDSNVMMFLSEVYFSPEEWLSNQSKTKYSALHPFARPKYIYYKLYFENEYVLHRWAFNFKLRGQLASNNLLPSEQYYLGGEGTVRGYENRIVSRDNALNINAEIKMPPIKILFRKKTKISEQLIIHTFVDFGMGADHKKSSFLSGKSLLGTGIGCRYLIKNNVSAKFDWGIPLLRLYGTKRQQLYLSVVASF